MKNIYATQEKEISCTECFDLVSSFVDLELSGADPGAKMPLVNQHLQQCTACRDEYEALRDISRLDNEGGGPSIDDLKASI